MNKILTRISIILAVGLLLGACKKLNVFPANANVDGDLIVDQQSAQAVLNGVYYRFANASLDPYGSQSTKWTAINAQFPSEMAGSMIPPYYYDDSILSVSFSPSFGLVDSVWTYGYSLVNAANGFIKNMVPVTNLPATVKQQMLAEARFLRAFANSELLFAFGQYRDLSSRYGIILRDTFVTAANVSLPRSGVDAAYTSILADLDVAEKGLPVLNSSIYYANVSDAKLLRARVLMNRASAGDYAEVIALTNDIITNGPFVLQDSLKNIFLSNGYGSREVMLALKPYSNQNDYSLWTPADRFMSLSADDGRSQWLYRPGVIYGDTTLLLTKYISGDPFDPTTNPLLENSYVFRLSEAYLLEAEAIVLSGADLVNAKALLKTVMAHAGAGATEIAAVDNASTPEALQLEIVKENLRNFVFENGVDWSALRRLPFTTIQKMNPNIKDPNRLILPIPTAELQYNNIFQNPGY